MRLLLFHLKILVLNSVLSQKYLTVLWSLICQLIRYCKACRIYSRKLGAPYTMHDQIDLSATPFQRLLVTVLFSEGHSKSRSLCSLSTALCFRPDFESMRCYISSALPSHPSTTGQQYREPFVRPCSSWYLQTQLRPCLHLLDKPLILQIQSRSSNGKFYALQYASQLQQSCLY